MKKYFYFLIATCLLFSFCSKEEQKEKKEDKEEKEPNRRERVRWCPDPFYVFSVDIKKESADYALFFKGTQIDKEAIYFYKEVNGKEQRYYPMIWIFIMVKPLEYPLLNLLISLQEKRKHSI